MICGLEIALEFSIARYMPVMYIYLDNLNIAKNARKISNKSNQAIFVKFHKLTKLWLVKKGEKLTI